MVVERQFEGKLLLPSRLFGLDIGIGLRAINDLYRPIMFIIYGPIQMLRVDITFFMITKISMAPIKYY